MRVGVGYSENPDSNMAGREAAQEALKQANKNTPCDMILMFSTARHDAQLLRDSVVTVLGTTAKVVGGGAVGTISNDRFGYAGDQVGLAAFWFEDSRCEVLTEGGLSGDEEEVGKRLGKRLADIGTTPESHVMLFYDAIDYSQGAMRMIMATYLLKGMQQGLGFLPDLTGAGMQGDYVCTPMKQWVGEAISDHHALALAFSGDVRMDSIIMHGCKPSGGYYTVTKTDRQSILEINGEPALSFIIKVLGGSIQPEDLPYFLILGMNRGDKWAEFDEKNYANRLCLAIDKERDALVMFEPDMIEGTEFQIMYRSVDLSYIAPNVESLFAELNGGQPRKPVFAFYIDCAGRAGGYGGMDVEDAVMVQQSVAGRVPLLGIYSGVEIASVGGQPRGLDWTGVFCLFSVAQ